MALSPVVLLVPLALLFAAGAGGKKRRPTEGIVVPPTPGLPEGEEEPEPDVDGEDDAGLEIDLPPKTTPQWPQMAKPSPIAVGMPNDPEIASLLRQMEDEFTSLGVDLRYVTPEEVTVMPKAPGRPVAIPPMEFWPRMAQTLRELFIPLRIAMGMPLQARGYRAPDYNEAVDGAPGSRHQWFEGIDIRPVGGTAADKRRLAMLAAQMYLDRGDELQIGFGVYGKSAPTVHFDTGYDKRTWRDAKYWLEKIGYAGARRLRAMAGMGRMDVRSRLLVAQAMRV